MHEGRHRCRARVVQASWIIHALISLVWRPRSETSSKASTRLAAAHILVVQEVIEYTRDPVLPRQPGGTLTTATPTATIISSKGISSSTRSSGRKISPSESFSLQPILVIPEWTWLGNVKAVFFLSEKSILVRPSLPRGWMTSAPTRWHPGSYTPLSPLGEDNLAFLVGSTSAGLASREPYGSVPSRGPKIVSVLSNIHPDEGDPTCFSGGSSVSLGNWRDHGGSR